MDYTNTILQDIKVLIEKYCDSSFNFQFDSFNPKLRLHEPTLSSQEINAALETLLSTYTTMGHKVQLFEEAYKTYVNSQHAIMCNSGSSANLLAIAALANPLTENHLKPGDEVLVPALAWSTTIWPLIQHQLIPVFVDCDPHSLNIDVNQLEAAITEKTKAIMIVHVYGNPCDMRPIIALVKKHNLFLIEDACEAMGATYEGKAVGTFGDVGTFSSFFSHHISTMEGGLAVTNQFSLAEMMRILRAHGWSREAKEHERYVEQNPHIDPRFIFINQGYNLRPTELNAAMGLVQLPKLTNYIIQRSEAAKCLTKHLSKFDCLSFQKIPSNGQSVWFGFPIIVKPNDAFELKALRAHLQAHHIETRPIIAGNMARHPGMSLYPHRTKGELSNADYVMNNAFALPCHQAMDDAACEYVAKTFDHFLSRYETKVAMVS